MKIRDIMSYNVITIPSSTSISQAKQIMTAHRIKRLPVVDKGKLIGIVTQRSIERASPSKATSLSVWELGYLLDKTPVKEIMQKKVVTVTPDTDAEEAVAIAQKNKVGSVVVVEDGAVVGIVTADDFFDNIIKPILGIDIPGTRIEVTDGIVVSKGAGQLEKIISIIHKFDYKIDTIHIEGPQQKAVRDVCFHILHEGDVTKLIAEFENQGYKVRIRNR
jgi:acetoin utilization protein AcuB